MENGIRESPGPFNFLGPSSLLLSVFSHTVGPLLKANVGDHLSETWGSLIVNTALLCPWVRTHAKIRNSFPRGTSPHLEHFSSPPLFLHLGLCGCQCVWRHTLEVSPSALSRPPPPALLEASGHVSSELPPLSSSKYSC